MNIVDIFSRITMFRKTSKMTGRSMVITLENEWIKNYGIPREIISDQGRQFTGDAYRDFRKINTKTVL